MITRLWATGDELWYIPGRESGLFPSPESRLTLDPPCLLCNGYHGLFPQR